MPHNVFLFGAGASYGSDTKGTPPLGAELFDELRRFNPRGWGAIPDRLAGRFREDFEAGMQEFSGSRSTDTDRLQRAMAAYFFQFQPQGTSLYVDLAKRIRAARWDGAMVTLNYERLLELSLRSVGINVAVGRTSGCGEVEVVFPHGCCHLFGQIQVGEGITLGQGIVLNSSVRVIEDPDEHERELRTSVVPPVMSYFEPAKQTRSGVSFIEGQRARWGYLAQEAATVAIVGVRVRPHDAHIWDPLAETNARIVYCGGPSGAPEYRNWAAQARPGHQDQDVVVERRFRDEFETICRETALS